jgi:hypothetical protein
LSLVARVRYTSTRYTTNVVPLVFFFSLATSSSYRPFGRRSNRVNHHDFRSMPAVILFIVDRFQDDFSLFSDATDLSILSSTLRLSAHEHRIFHSSRSEKRIRFRERQTTAELGIRIVTTRKNNGRAFTIIVGQYCCNHC